MRKQNVNTEDISPPRPRGLGLRDIKQMNDTMDKKELELIIKEGEI